MRRIQGTYMTIFSICIIFIFNACNKELEDRDYPRLYTLDPINVGEKGATFKTELNNSTNDEILKKGFIWSKSNLFPANADTIFIDETGKNNFLANVNYALPVGEEISFCSFAVTNKYKVTGNVKTFVSKGCSPAIIDDYSPKIGIDGDIITIKGNNFTSVPYNYQITFNEFYGLILSCSKNEIKASLPINYNSPGKCTVALKMFNDSYVIGEFTLDYPRIIDLNSDNFKIAESEIKITFNSKVYKIGSVTIGSTSVESKKIRISDNKISFTTPSNIAEGEYYISGLVNNKSFITGQKVNFSH